LLAAALDQPFDPIVAAEVGAARNNPSAELLATWLEDRLDVPVSRKITRGPGITGVQLLTKRGEIAVTRPDGRLATLVRTGQPDRSVALPRRTTEELLSEELRRLDPDDVYNETIQRVFGAKPTAPRAADSGRKALLKRPAPARKSAAAKAAEVADNPAASATRRGRARKPAAADVSRATVSDGTVPRPSTTARAMEAKPPMPPSKKAPASVTASPSSARRPRKSAGASKQSSAAAKKGAAAARKSAAAKKPSATKNPSATKKTTR
jgi:hypothetical protein